MYRCKELEAILNSDSIPINIKEEAKKKFGKDCYFSLDGTTKIGKYIELGIDTTLNKYYYVLQVGKFRYHLYVNEIAIKKL